MGFLPFDSTVVRADIATFEAIGRGELIGQVFADTATGDIKGIATDKPGEHLRLGEQTELAANLGGDAEFIGLMDPQQAMQRAESLRGLLSATDLVKTSRRSPFAFVLERLRR